MQNKGEDSGLYLVCLDEMNLAQVEHYFSGFMQELSRAPNEREIPIFDPSCLAPDDPFYKWSRLPLKQNLRFIGTVNFDETTKQISHRMLDRSNLIKLEAETLQSLELLHPLVMQQLPVKQLLPETCSCGLRTGRWIRNQPMYYKQFKNLLRFWGRQLPLDVMLLSQNFWPVQILFVNENLHLIYK